MLFCGFTALHFIGKYSFYSTIFIQQMYYDFLLPNSYISLKHECVYERVRNNELLNFALSLASGSYPTDIQCHCSLMRTSYTKGVIDGNINCMTCTLTLFTLKLYSKLSFVPHMDKQKLSYFTNIPLVLQD